NYIRYIGAGAVAAGGIISLIKSMPLIVSTFVDAIKGIKGGKDNANIRTEQDLDMRFIGAGVLLMIIIIWLLPQIPVTLIGAALIVLFGFFFGAVSSRMVGLVGSSNNPVSGMAIATLLIATLCLKATGDGGTHGMTGAIAIGSIICIIAAMAGDTSQDLKTGYILGATPKKQQIGELIGAIISALTIGGVLILLDSAWGFGTEALSAPQATLMKMIVEGVMDGNLPWTLVFIGVFIAIVIEILGIAVLPVAIGLYLPLELSATIMVGGLIRHFVDKKNQSEDSEAGSGVLFCSGLIAGEGLVGILLAILTVVKVADKIDLSGYVQTGMIGGVILFVIMIALVVKFATRQKKEV
ncbi:MAG: oligopeptide transporter, OPT family, partial [Lachnospiraceae bacterium]|nr:oligopeptide transporter, OPT family [Lachnospiraceae bacterium]